MIISALKAGISGEVGGAVDVAFYAILAAFVAAAVLGWFIRLVTGASRRTHRAGLLLYRLLVAAAVVKLLVLLTVLVDHMHVRRGGESWLARAAAASPEQILLANLPFAGVLALWGLGRLHARRAPEGWLRGDVVMQRCREADFGWRRSLRVPPGAVAVEPSECEIRFAGQLLERCREAFLVRDLWSLTPTYYVCTAGHRSEVAFRIQMSMQDLDVFFFQCFESCQGLLDKRDAVTVSCVGRLLEENVSEGVRRWADDGGDLPAHVRAAIRSSRPWRLFDVEVELAGEAPRIGDRRAKVEALSPTVEIGGLDRALEIDRFPVTCGEYGEYLRSLPGRERRRRTPLGWDENRAAGRRDHPVTGVSWHDARAYARAHGKRLPTAPEWEQAAKWDPRTGRAEQVYPWGDFFNPDFCNCRDNEEVREEYGGTTPVCYFRRGRSNAGCYDMSGNALEWCEDDAEGGAKVLKGGSWMAGRGNTADDVKIATNHYLSPERREPNAGFRCCG